MRYCLLLLVLVLSLRAWAQNDKACSLQVQGRVTEATTGKPVGFAAIYVKETGLGSMTDSLGNYVIEGLCPGHYTLLVHHMAYGEVEVHLDFEKEDHDHDVDFSLHEEALEIGEIRISTARVQDVGANPVSNLEGTALAQTRGQSLGAALKGINGVNAIQAGPQIFKPVIHGLHSQRILILNQGLRQEDQQWGRDHAPMVDPFQASRLSVVKGAAAIRYSPDAMAGIVVVDPPAMPRTEALRGQLNLVGMSNGRQGIASGRLEGALKALPGLSWRVQATGKYGGDMHAPDYSLTNTGVRELNLGGSLAYYRETWGIEASYSQFKTELGILRSAHIGNIGDFLDAFERDEPFYVDPFSYEINNPRQQVKHGLFKVKGFLDLKDHIRLNVLYGRQENRRQEYDVRRGNRNEKPAMDLELTTHSLDAFVEQQVGEQLAFTYGLTGIFQKNRNLPGTGVRPFLPWYDSYAAAAYGIGKWQGVRTSWELGLRYDFKSYRALKANFAGSFDEFTYQYHTFSASGGMTTHLDERWSLKVNLGSSMRPPLVNELLSDGLHHSAARIEVGDSTLSPEWGLKAIAGISFRINQRLSIDFTPYYHYIRDFIFLQPDPLPRLTIRGVFPVYRYTQTDVGLLGLDLGLNWEFVRNWHYRSQLSILRARDLSQDDWLISMPSDRWTQTLSYERENLGPFRHFRTKLEGTWVAKQSRLPAVPELNYAEIPASYANRIQELEAYLETLYSSPPAYFLLGLELGASLPLAKNELDISLGVTNLLNARYREYLNNFWFYADEPARNVSLRFQYTF